jgi:hypothetical protein
MKILWIATPLSELRRNFVQWNEWVVSSDNIIQRNGIWCTSVTLLFEETIDIEVSEDEIILLQNKQPN